MNSKSESESRYENHCQYGKQNFKSENKNKSNKNKDVKAVKVKSGEALTKIKAKLTAKVNEVKAIEKTLTGSRVERKKQLNEKIGSEPTSTLPSRFTAMFNISIFIYIFTIFIFKNFISISYSIVFDLSDHQFQTFTVGEISDCKTFCLSRQTASVQAETLIKTLANPDSRRLFKVPDTRPDLRYRNPTWNPLVPSHLPSGQARKSETNLYHDPFIFNYLDFFR